MNLLKKCFLREAGKIDLNEFAREITLQEGKKISVNNAQVKEVLRLVLVGLAKKDESQVLELLNRYK